MAHLLQSTFALPLAALLGHVSAHVGQASAFGKSAQKNACVLAHPQKATKLQISIQ